MKYCTILLIMAGLLTPSVSAQDKRTKAASGAELAAMGRIDLFLTQIEDDDPDPDKPGIGLPKSWTHHDPERYLHIYPTLSIVGAAEEHAQNKTMPNLLIAHGGTFEDERYRLAMTVGEVDTVFSHPENKVNNLSTDELKSVLEGQTTNWSELGGPDQSIRIYVQGEELQYSTFKALRQRVVGEKEQYAKVIKSKDYDDLLKISKDDPGAIVFGFKDLSAAEEELDWMNIDGFCPIKALHEDLDCSDNKFAMPIDGRSLKQYPLVTPTRVYVKKDAPNATLALREYVQDVAKRIDEDRMPESDPQNE